MPTPEEEAAAKKAAEEKAAADKAKADQEAADAAKAVADAAKLGDGGKAALDAERKLKREAEARAKAAEAKLKALEDADATELEKATKRADEAESKLSTATEKARKANLLTALMEAGVPKAKAAARLLDGVEYDADSDEPTNLPDAITAAKAEYGEEMFKTAKPTAPDLNGGGGGGGPESGPTLTADELAAAQSSGMTPEEFKHYQDPHAGPYVPATKT